MVDCGRKGRRLEKINRSARGRQLAHRRRHRRLRAQACHEVLHSALALVTRLVQHVATIGRREVRREESDGGERQGTIGQQVQNIRELARSPGGFDPSIGGMFRQVKRLRAVGEERGIP